MSKDFDFNEIGKRMPYRVPDAFFENMQANLLKRADEEKKRRRVFRMRWGGTIALALAAMICGMVFLTSKPDTQVESLPVEEWMAQSTNDQDVVDLYIQGLTDEELEEWVEFSENDIYYELTTENLNEDEN